jgi:hypothetical protein
MIGKQMAELRSELVAIDWPDNAKPYADELVAAASEVELHAHGLQLTSSQEEGAALNAAIAKLRTTVALLRAALALPPPKMVNGVPLF